MTTVDFAPLFRTAIGFDRLARLVDTAASGQEAQTYPPYNIEKTGDDTYRLTMAVAGFRPEDLDLTVKDNTLVVSGRVAATKARRPRSCIAASPAARLSVASCSPTISSSKARTCRTACCTSA